VDAGATNSVALAVRPDGERLGRASGEGANPKRHGLEVAADRIAGLARQAPGSAATPALVFIAGAGIDRPEHARALRAALEARLRGSRVHVVNDTLAALWAGTADAVGLVVPVSTGGNVIGRGPDGRVTDRGHGIFGGGFVLGALAARAARRGLVGRELAAAVTDAKVGWRGRRPGPEVAGLAGAVIRAAEVGDPLPARMLARWLSRVEGSIREEVDRLGLSATPAVVLYGGLLDAQPSLAGSFTAAIRAGAPGAVVIRLAAEPAEGAALLARDAWAGRPMAWEFVPRR
jgi:N-acetylglucosamine kinase-like BadF-type ATPase